MGGALHVAACALVLGCGPSASRSTLPPAPTLGQWVWTRADAARFVESAAARRGLLAGVFVGAVRCDTASGTVVATAGLPPDVVPVATPVAVIRFEDGLDQCRGVSDRSAAFEAAVDSAVGVLRRRGGNVAYGAVQLDFDAPQRALRAWATTVRRLRTGALRGDSVWVTSLVAHLREPEYGALFGGVVSGHVLQVFDTGEPATEPRVAEAVRLVRRAGVPFQIGVGAFERETRRGRTEHRAWFDAIPRFAEVEGYAGVWVFPAGHRWVTLFPERM